jgi:selenide,water dikinase
VRPHTQWGSVGEIDQLLLPDAQTSGGLLVAGEVPGATVIGDLTSAAEYSVIVD